MTARCEPPEGLRGVDGWHWVDADRPIVGRWSRASDNLAAVWRLNNTQHSPEGAHKRGYRYLAPVTPPAEVDALREEVRRLLAIIDGMDPDALTGCADDALPGTADDYRAAVKEPTP